MGSLPDAVVAVAGICPGGQDVGTHGKNQQQERQQAEHAAAERAQEKREHKVRRGTAIRE